MRVEYLHANRNNKMAHKQTVEIHAVVGEGLAPPAHLHANQNKSLHLSDACGCEGEVASVQGEYSIYDSFGTDDGRGVLSARELSNNYS